MVTARLFEIRDHKLGALPAESVDWMVAILTAMAKKVNASLLQLLCLPQSFMCLDAESASYAA
jgi:hypothetical protein